jgi:voltage-gated potassium channel
MEQIVVNQSSALVGTSLVTSNLRQRFGVIVVGIQRAAGKMEFNPPPDAVIQTGRIIWSCSGGRRISRN